MKKMRGELRRWGLLMGAPGPRWVLCRGATHRDAPADALRISVGHGNKYGGTVFVESLESRMTGTLAFSLHDRMTFASFVLAADCATSRGSLTAVDNGAPWRREFHLVVPVADPERWRQPDLIRALESTLGFLSDYSWDIYFEPRSDRAMPAQIRFARQRTAAPSPRGDQVDDVLLFSGGMDSFSGVVGACIGERRRPLLVSHRSSSKIGKV